jgi:hypothetical protein
MSFLPEEIKKPCAFLIRTDRPLDTLKDMVRILSDRNIRVESMNMHGMGAGESIVILHCRIEKDRIRIVQNNLERMQGVIELELLESKGLGMIKI